MVIIRFQCNGYGHNVGSQIISQKANIHYIHKMINLKQTCNMKNGDELQSEYENEMRALSENELNVTIYLT